MPESKHQFTATLTITSSDDNFEPMDLIIDFDPSVDVISLEDYPPAYFYMMKIMEYLGEIVRKQGGKAIRDTTFDDAMPGPMIDQVDSLLADPKKSKN